MPWFSSLIRVKGSVRLVIPIVSYGPGKTLFQYGGTLSLKGRHLRNALAQAGVIWGSQASGYMRKAKGRAQSEPLDPRFLARAPGSTINPQGWRSSSHARRRQSNGRVGGRAGGKQARTWGSRWKRWKASVIPGYSEERTVKVAGRGFRGMCGETGRFRKRQAREKGGGVASAQRFSQAFRAVALPAQRRTLVDPPGTFSPPSPPPTARCPPPLPASWRYKLKTNATPTRRGSGVPLQASPGAARLLRAPSESAEEGQGGPSIRAQTCRASAGRNSLRSPVW